jgi:multimeric flavodoxin WrbA
MASSSAPISIVVINGSVRPGNYTAMAVAIVVDELQKHPKVSVEVVDPAKFNLPFPGTDPASPATKRLQEIVRGATGVILATPEYHGSFSSVMKLVIENRCWRESRCSCWGSRRARSAPSSPWNSCAASSRTLAAL